MTDIAASTTSTRRRATLIGAIAVLLWATLALFTASTGSVPPFQLMAMTFAIAFAFAALKWLHDAATKGAVISLTRTLAAEWARHNVQVNAIAPGWFVTDMNEAAFADPRIHERLTRDVPARRTGRLEEIGPLAVYLASPGSDFMTGQTIFLDGGHSAA